MVPGNLPACGRSPGGAARRCPGQRDRAAQVRTGAEVGAKPTEKLQRIAVRGGDRAPVHSSPKEDVVFQNSFGAPTMDDCHVHDGGNGHKAVCVGRWLQRSPVM
jgi:hypothetical protein